MSTLREGQSTPQSDAVEAAGVALEELHVAESSREVSLSSGRSLELSVEGSADRIRVRGRGGRVELTVLLTEAGPKLIFEAADVEIKSLGAVTVDCDRFAVNAKSETSIRSEDVRVEATVGSVTVKANDAVTLDGEEVRMNCDAPDSIPPWMRDSMAAQFAKSAPMSPPQDVQGDPTLFDEFERQK